MRKIDFKFDKILDEGKLKLLGILIIIVVISVVYSYFTLAHLVFKWDALSLFSPYFTLISDFARSGQFLLWNPWSNCGSPDMAYIELGSFCPLTVFIAFLTGGGHSGFLIYWLVIWAIGGIGMMFLASHLKAPTWGALAVTIAFMFSGYYLGNATHTSWLYGFSFLPFMVWRLDVALQKKILWPIVEAGALFGLSALAGHPALIILNGLFLGCWAVGRKISQIRVIKFSSMFKVMTLLVLLLLVGIIILSPAYISFFSEGAGYTDRVGSLERSFAISNHALTPGAIASLSSPYLSVLKLYNPELWPGTFVGLTCCYIGAFVPVLALFVLLAKPKEYSGWWILGIALLSLACAVGPLLPFRGWLYDLCPPTTLFPTLCSYAGLLSFCNLYFSAHGNKVP